MPPRSALNYADIYAPRVPILSSTEIGWHIIGAQLFECRDLGRVQISLPPATEHIITLQTDGATELQGRVVRRYAPHHAVPGDVFVIPGGEPTEWEWTTDCRILCIYIHPYQLSQIAAEATDTDPARLEIIPRVNERDPLLEQLGLALMAELQSGGIDGPMFAESLAQTLVLHVLRKHTVFPVGEQRPKGRLHNHVQRRVLEYIQAHLARDLTLAEVAAVAGVSPYYFARLFRRSFGSSIHQYVVEQRLEAARRLLVAGRLTIGEIAATTGFADQSHLQRLFKRRYGITPGALREPRTNLQRERTNLQDEQGPNE